MNPHAGGNPDSFKLDPGYFSLPVDFGDVCINYDKAYFEVHDLVVPTSLEELASPNTRGCSRLKPCHILTGWHSWMATIASSGKRVTWLLAVPGG